MKEKDRELFLTSALKVFVVLFITTFVLRLIGFDKFGFDIDDTNYRLIIKIFENYFFTIIRTYIVLFITSFLMLKMICENNNKKIYYIVALSISFIFVLSQAIEIFLFKNVTLARINTILNPLLLLSAVFIIDKKFKMKRFLIVFILNISYQAMASFIRNISIHDSFSPIYDFLLNFDYIILLIVSYLIYLKKGSANKWVFKAAGSYGVQQIFSRRSDLESQKKSLSREQKVERLSNIFYLILSIIWNVFTLICVIYITTFNTTLITTLFIITSFMITKTTFGEAFHFNSMYTCFIISNLVYFIVSRVTTSVNISFWIPILIGIALSYGASLLVKNRSIEVHKGMNETILRNKCEAKQLNEYETNLLVDFYAKKMTLVKLSLKYNYSKESIFLHKQKAIKKLKGQ